MPTAEERVAAMGELNAKQRAALRDRLTVWLDRKRVLGLVRDDTVRVVEQLIREMT